MHYYIDGYNLMFRISRNHDDLAAQRQGLIEDLAAKTKLLGLSITVVFDAQYQSNASTRSHFQNLEIVFTEEGKTADEYILDEIQAERRNSCITVVTSDKKLAWFARRCSASTETVERFFSWLNKRYKKRLIPQRPSPKIIPKSVPQPIAPLKEASPEQCACYYEDAFIKRFNKLQEESPKRQKVEQRAKSKKKKASLSQSAYVEFKNLSDADRWTKIFENRINNK